MRDRIHSDFKTFVVFVDVDREKLLLSILIIAIHMYVTCRCTSDGGRHAIYMYRLTSQRGGEVVDFNILSTNLSTITSKSKTLSTYN